MDAQTTITKAQWNYLFRGDDGYQGGPIGLPLGAESSQADIQDFAEHVFRKERHRTSRYSSFSTEVRIARKFTSADDNRFLMKIEWRELQAMEAAGIIRIWDPDRVYDELRRGPKKLAKRAADVRTAMKRNNEILIEGEIPANALAPVE